MQRFILSIVFVMVASFAVMAQDNTQTPPANANPNAPEITFDKTTHDYGTIFQGSDGTCEFKFTNSGKEPLILSKPISSCGCTVPTWPQEPVLPGKGDAIKVTYATHNVGPFQKTITVNSNASNNRVLLTIKGNVVAKPAETMPEKPTDNGSTPVNK